MSLLVKRTTLAASKGLLKFAATTLSFKLIARPYNTAVILAGADVIHNRFSAEGATCKRTGLVASHHVFGRQYSNNSTGNNDKIDSKADGWSLTNPPYINLRNHAQEPLEQRTSTKARTFEEHIQTLVEVDQALRKLECALQSLVAATDSVCGDTEWANPFHGRGWQEELCFEDKARHALSVVNETIRAGRKSLLERYEQDPSGFDVESCSVEVEKFTSLVARALSDIRESFKVPIDWFTATTRQELDNPRKLLFSTIRNVCESLSDVNEVLGGVNGLETIAEQADQTSGKISILEQIDKYKESLFTLNAKLRKLENALQSVVCLTSYDTRVADRAKWAQAVESGHNANILAFEKEVRYVLAVVNETLQDVHCSTREPHRPYSEGCRDTNAIALVGWKKMSVDSVQRVVSAWTNRHSLTRDWEEQRDDLGKGLIREVERVRECFDEIDEALIAVANLTE